jgi:hypothetical protein
MPDKTSVCILYPSESKQRQTTTGEKTENQFLNGIYGFCEGPRVGKRFEHILESGNFRVTRDVRRADIIIAHSGGCFVVPENNHAKLVLLIGLPCWPGKSTAKALRQKVWLDIITHQRNGLLAEWLQKTGWHSWYFWNMANNRRMLRGMRAEAHRTATDAVLVRNQNDVQCTPDPRQLHFNYSPPLLSLPGQHDDCWLHPEPYIAIIQSYYGQKLLAQTGE